MKSYTDIEQSKKLAEILPLESADMHYNNASIKGMNYVDEHRAELMDYITAKTVLSKYMINPLFEVIPCWSLAVLFDLLPNNEHISTTISRGSWKIDTVEYIPNTWWCEYEDSEDYTEFHISADNPVDVCYEMIIKLHEQKLL